MPACAHVRWEMPTSRAWTQKEKLKIMIDDEKCIKCGACIRACSHSARSYIDDTQRFLQDLANGQEIALIAAPSIKIAFDGNWRHALQWLSNHGIKKNL